MIKNRLFAIAFALFIFSVPVFAQNAAENNTAAEKTEKPKKEKKAKNKDNSKDKPKKEEKKNYTGWIDTSTKDIDFKSGIIHLRARPKLGTFNIAVINDDGKSIPVLSTANEFTTSSLFLKYNKKEYKLETESNIKTAARKLKNGIELYYGINEIAEVYVTLECVESDPENGFDMLKVTSKVVNIGTKRAEISQKILLDTILGETDRYHFYTKDEVPIQNEVLYRTMQNEKWFISKNNSASMQILLEGADITPIDAVALANYSTLSKNTWEPEMLAYRSFDTVLSYNNSAVGIYWPSKEVGVNGKTTSVMYLAFATDKNTPQGYAYIENRNSIKPKEIPSVNVPVISEEKIVENPKTIAQPVKEPVVEPVSEPVVATKTLPVKEEPKANSVVEKKPENTPVPEVKQPEPPKKVETQAKPVPNVKFDVNTLSKEQLSPEYIQNLLDRILALEESDAIVNRDELLELNAELDAILESLR